MNIVTLDFETYFDEDYTLKKMTTEAYIRDPRFEVHGLGVKYQGQKGWIQGDRCRDWLESFFYVVSPSVACLAHHAQFDGLILSHHFGIKPALWLDTLSMARQVLGTHVSASLDSLAKHYGLAAKNVPYNLFRGKHWHQLTEDEQRLVADGCLHDCDLTFDIFQRLAASFPSEEYGVVDMTTRMFTEPVLEADVDLLGKVWSSENAKKRDLLAELGVQASDLQSANKFADLLRAEGVDPPMKEGKNGKIYAFAKTDDFMKEGLEDENVVGTLVRARLGVRSTIDQTRAERLGFMATRGACPVYLRYCGAHTTRWSGGDSLNWQNFRRGSDIRRAIKAPGGYALAVVDASQIECRILNALAGQQDVLDAFRENRDIYSEGASRFYGRTITRADKVERHLGKTLELGCGYGMGWQKFQATCRLGAMGGPAIVLTEEDAQVAIDSYRASHPQVTTYWSAAGRMIARLGGGDPMWWGPMLVKDKRVILPNGGWVDYSTLEYHARENDDDLWEDGWRHKTRQSWSRLYGGKLVENVVQALARVVLSQCMLRVRKEGFRVVNCTHDEFVALVKIDGNERKAYEWMLAEMSRSPVWLPEVPLAAEGALEEFYAK